VKTHVVFEVPNGSDVGLEHHGDTHTALGHSWQLAAWGAAAGKATLSGIQPGAGGALHCKVLMIF
jgi:hypothetical protein